MTELNILLVIMALGLLYQDYVISKLEVKVRNLEFRLMAAEVMHNHRDALEKLKD